MQDLVTSMPAIAIVAMLPILSGLVLVSHESGISTRQTRRGMPVALEGGPQPPGADG